MTSEANKALEWLRKFEHGECDSSQFMAMTQKTLRAALTRLSEIEPVIQELVEAANKLDIENCSSTVGAMHIQNRRDGIWNRWWLDFVDFGLKAHALAANRIAALGDKT